MKQNQQNKNKNTIRHSSLGDLRKKIDRIDDELTSLLKERMSVVKEVGKLKERNKDNFFIKSAREADMMQILIQKTKNFIKPQATFNIWRSLITSANILEQKITAFIYNPNNNSEIATSVNNYYGNLIEIAVEENAKILLKKASKDNATIIAVCAQNNDNFWQELIENYKSFIIFAKISQKLSKKPNIFLMAKKSAEKSKADNSVIYIESKLNSEEIGQFLIKNDFKIVNVLELKFNKKEEPEPIKYLVEIEKFYLEDDKKLMILSKQPKIDKIKILGNYPRNF